MKKIKLIALLSSVFLLSVSFLFNTPTIESHDLLMEKGSDINSKSCLRMYYLIETYSDSFCIPKHIAYNVAYKETRYRGPFDTLYNPYQTSKSGAVGAMQIIPKYASYYAGRKVTKAELLNDLELNVMVSMKILSEHYSKYKNWSKTCGAYNTGQPKINSYAKYCQENLEYTVKWITIDSLTLLSFLSEL